jgi:2-methylcitrate dehydratase PrpD
MSVNPLKAYGEWVANVNTQWTPEGLHLAHRELIDLIAVLVPGSVTPVARKVLRRVSEWGSGDITVAGSSQKLALPWAALHNGTAGHALDFDDNFDPAKCHVSTVFWPTILAVAEKEKSSGQDCLDAFIVALQIVGRIGQAVNPTHRKRGWHATATLGVLGAAIATARLLKLDANQTAMAISLATSTSGGFMSQFGTMAKPFHAGHAAKNGIMAAYFAQDGMNAGWHTLDGPFGMNTLMVGPDREALKAAIGVPEHGQTLSFETESIGEPLMITEHKFRVKRFPTCGSAARSLDCVLALREEHGFKADDVERVDVHAPAMHLKNLMYERPEDGLQGKFSVEYPVSCVLIQGQCTLADFTDEAVARPQHRRLFERIHRHPVDIPETEMDTRVVITLKNGQTFEKSVFMAFGSKTAPFPTEMYWQKFDQCTEHVMNPSDQHRLKQALEGFPDLGLASEMIECLAVDLNPAGPSGPV